jgi:hypothetical protein
MNVDPGQQVPLLTAERDRALEQGLPPWVVLRAMGRRAPRSDCAGGPKLSPPAPKAKGCGTIGTLLPLKMIRLPIQDQQIWQLLDSTGCFPDINDELLPEMMISDTCGTKMTISQA